MPTFGAIPQSMPGGEPELKKTLTGPFSRESEDGSCGAHSHGLPNATPRPATTRKRMPGGESELTLLGQQHSETSPKPGPQCKNRKIAYHGEIPDITLGPGAGQNCMPGGESDFMATGDPDLKTRNPAHNTRIGRWFLWGPLPQASKRSAQIKGPRGTIARRRI